MTVEEEGHGEETKLDRDLVNTGSKCDYEIRKQYEVWRWGDWYQADWCQVEQQNVEQLSGEYQGEKPHWYWEAQDLECEESVQPE